MADALQGQEPIAVPTTDAGQEPVQQDAAPVAAPTTTRTYDEDYVKKLRAEAAANRTAAAELKKLQDAQLTETERIKKERDELVSERERWAQERRALLVSNAVTRFVAQTDTLDPDWLQEKLSKSALLELDEETGVPTSESLEKALKEIRKAHAALFKVPANPQTAPAPNVSTGSVINADRTQQSPSNPNEVLSLSDPRLWNGSQATKRA